MKRNNLTEKEIAEQEYAFLDFLKQNQYATIDKVKKAGHYDAMKRYGGILKAKKDLEVSNTFEKFITGVGKSLENEESFKELAEYIIRGTPVPMTSEERSLNSIFGSNIEVDELAGVIKDYVKTNPPVDNKDYRDAFFSNLENSYLELRKNKEDERIRRKQLSDETCGYLSFIAYRDLPSGRYRTLLEEKVDDVLATLTPRDEYVLRKRFGIGVDSEHSVEEVAGDLEVTRERIRQIEAKAIRKLRHPSRSKKLKSFVEYPER